MNLHDYLRELTSQPHGWTSFEQAAAMASAVIALRPAVSIEIGVYAGKGLVTLGLAHKEVGKGFAIGIDPYTAQAAVEGQLNPEDAKWWADVNFESIYQMCQDNIQKFQVGQWVKMFRMRSDEAPTFADVGVLRIDGNHGEMVLRDIEKFTPCVTPGGILFLDDISWTGNSVLHGAEKLKAHGWRELYRIDDGAVFQKGGE